jgi:hypothetical protein
MPPQSTPGPRRSCVAASARFRLAAALTLGLLQPDAAYRMRDVSGCYGDEFLPLRVEAALRLT